MIQKIQSPCYDPITHTDCPRRCGGCTVNCPEWATYVSERNKSYEKRKTLGDASSFIFESGMNRHVRRAKGKIEDRRRHRK